MYHTRTGSYDEIPEGMKYYINNYGCHFNKKLCDEAISRMYYVDRATYQKHKLKQYVTKEDIDKLCSAYNVTINNNKLYDAVYVANMCKADFWGDSITTEEQLIKYVRDVIDDIDAEEGYIFNRFYADSIFSNNPIEWDDMV